MSQTLIQKIVYEMTPESLETAIESAIGKVIKDSFMSTYEGRTLDTSAACQHLGISKATLYRYVDEKKLVPSERTGRNYTFDLRYLLEYRIEEVKGKKAKQAAPWKI